MKAVLRMTEGKAGSQTWELGASLQQAVCSSHAQQWHEGYHIPTAQLAACGHFFIGNVQR